MLVLDAETLAKHFANGTLSKDKFVKLSASLGKVEREAIPESIFEQCLQLVRCPKDLRNYTLRWRLLTAWRYVKYLAVASIALVISVLIRVDTGDLEYMMEYGFDTDELIDLVIAGTPEALPEDINEALGYMLNKNSWERLHVRHIGQHWKTLNESEKKTIQNTLRFREFALMVAIKNVEQRKRLVDGELGAARYLAELKILNELIS